MENVPIAVVSQGQSTWKFSWIGFSKPLTDLGDLSPTQKLGSTKILKWRKLDTTDTKVQKLDVSEKLEEMQETSVEAKDCSSTGALLPYFVLCVIEVQSNKIWEDLLKWWASVYVFICSISQEWLAEEKKLLLFTLSGHLLCKKCIILQGSSHLWRHICILVLEDEKHSLALIYGLEAWFICECKWTWNEREPKRIFWRNPKWISIQSLRLSPWQNISISRSHLLIKLQGEKTGLMHTVKNWNICTNLDEFPGTVVHVLCAFVMSTPPTRAKMKFKRSEGFVIHNSIRPWTLWTDRASTKTCQSTLLRKSAS